MTGDFAISKRKYMKGYNIETPSLIENANNRNSRSEKRHRELKTKEVMTENPNENLFASVESKPLPVNSKTSLLTDRNSFIPVINKISKKVLISYYNRQEKYRPHNISAGKKKLFKTSVFIILLIFFISILLFALGLILKNKSLIIIGIVLFCAIALYTIISELIIHELLSSIFN
jgi:hypothetical protein